MPGPLPTALPEPSLLEQIRQVLERLAPMAAPAAGALAPFAPAAAAGAATAALVAPAAYTLVNPEMRQRMAQMAQEAVPTLQETARRYTPWGRYVFPDQPATLSSLTPSYGEGMTLVGPPGAQASQAAPLDIPLPERAFPGATASARITPRSDVAPYDRYGPPINVFPGELPASRALRPGLPQTYAGELEPPAGIPQPLAASPYPQTYPGELEPMPGVAQRLRVSPLPQAYPGELEPPAGVPQRLAASSLPLTYPGELEPPATVPRPVPGPLDVPAESMRSTPAARQRVRQALMATQREPYGQAVAPRYYEPVYPGEMEPEATMARPTTRPTVSRAEAQGQALAPRLPLEVPVERTRPVPQAAYRPAATPVDRYGGEPIVVAPASLVRARYLPPLDVPVDAARTSTVAAQRAAMQGGIHTQREAEGQPVGGVYVPANVLPQTYPGELEPEATLPLPLAATPYPQTYPGELEPTAGVRQRLGVSPLPQTYPGELEPAAGVALPLAATPYPQTYPGELEPIAGVAQKLGVSTLPQTYPGEFEPTVGIPQRLGVSTLPQTYPGELEPPAGVMLRPRVSALPQTYPGELEPPAGVALEPQVGAAPTVRGQIERAGAAARGGETAWPAPPAGAPPEDVATGKVEGKAPRTSARGEIAPQPPAATEAPPPAETAPAPIDWGDDDWGRVTGAVLGQALPATEMNQWLKAFRAEHEGRNPWEVGPGDAVNNFIDHLLAYGESRQAAQSGTPITPQWWEEAHTQRYGLQPGQVRPLEAPLQLALARLNQ